MSKSETTALIAIDDFTALTDFFQHMGRCLGGGLTAFEVMWKEHYQMIAIDSGRHTPPLGAGHEYYVVVEANGIDADHDTAQFTRAVEQAIEKETVADAALASSKAQRDDIWAIREDIAGLAMALLPGAVFDISLPIVEMCAYVDNLKETVRKEWNDTARMVVFGHLGDGNLHVIISARPWNDAARKRAEMLVYEPLAKIGGSISAEHGIGLEKRSYLHLSRSAEEIALMRKLKKMFDPKGILNPGKVLISENITPERDTH